MMLVSFPLAFLVIRSIKETNYEDEKVVYVDDIKHDAAEAGTPAGAELEKASVSSHAA
jgi:hypothetical protein